MSDFDNNNLNPEGNNHTDNNQNPSSKVPEYSFWAENITSGGQPGNANGYSGNQYNNANSYSGHSYSDHSNNSNSDRNRH